MIQGAPCHVLLKAGIGSIRRRLSTSLLGSLVLVVAACSPTRTSGQSSQPDLNTPAPSLSAPTGSSSPSASPPGLNQLETRIIEALRSLNLRGEPSQLNLTSADIGVRLEDGNELFVSANPSDVDGAEYTVRRERQIEGVVVKEVELDSIDGVQNQFDCGDVTYTTQGNVPPGFNDFDAFLSSLIVALACR